MLQETLLFVVVALLQKKNVGVGGGGRSKSKTHFRIMSREREREKIHDSLFLGGPFLPPPESDEKLKNSYDLLKSFLFLPCGKPDIARMKIRGRRRRRGKEKKRAGVGMSDIFSTFPHS